MNQVFSLKLPEGSHLAHLQIADQIATAKTAGIAEHPKAPTNTELGQLDNAFSLALIIGGTALASGMSYINHRTRHPNP